MESNSQNNLIKNLQYSAKIFLLLIISSTLLIFTGCGFIAEKITGKVVEGFIENAAGDDVDIDFDDDKIVIKGEDGNEMVFGGGEWPAGDAAKTIPVFKDGKIDYVNDFGTSAMISITGVTKNEYLDYVEKLKAAGFTENSYSAESEGSFTYMAYKTDTHFAMVTFDTEGGLVITVSNEE
ncbi:MAG: hypothetical protein PHZ09_08430 [Eubacteriales bacterium]|jgi:hypothetical protein|nr:hypothetical protein [Eubacteriales bacterium]